MATDILKLREMTEEELEKEAQGLRKEIWKLRIQQSSGQLHDLHKVQQTRKRLARVLTIRRERELIGS